MEITKLPFEQPMTALKKARRENADTVDQHKIERVKERQNEELNNGMANGDNVTKQLEADEEFMTSLALLTDRLTNLNIDYDDPRVVAIGKSFQDLNRS